MHYNYPGIFTCSWKSLLDATSNLGLLLSGDKEQPENTYFYIFKVTGKVWDNQVSTELTITNPIGKDGVRGWLCNKTSFP